MRVLAATPTPTEASRLSCLGRRLHLVYYAHLLLEGELHRLHRLALGLLGRLLLRRRRRIFALVTDQNDSDEEVGVAFGCCGSLKSRSAAKTGRVSLVQSLWSNLLGAKAPRQDSPVKEGVWSPGQKARKPSLASWLSRG